MTSNIQRESATIYQFPQRGRFAAPSSFADTSTLVPSMKVAAAIDSSWYHAEAIQEAAELGRKH